MLSSNLILKRSRLAKSVAIHDNFNKHGIIFNVRSFLNVLVRSELPGPKAWIFVGPGSTKKCLVLWTHVWLHGKRDVFSFLKVWVLIQKVERSPVVVRPF